MRLPVLVALLLGPEGNFLAVIFDQELGQQAARGSTFGSVAE